MPFGILISHVGLPGFKLWINLQTVFCWCAHSQAEGNGPGGWAPAGCVRNLDWAPVFWFWPGLANPAHHGCLGSEEVEGTSPLLFNLKGRITERWRGRDRMSQWVNGWEYFPSVIWLLKWAQWPEAQAMLNTPGAISFIWVSLRWQGLKHPEAIS